MMIVRPGRILFAFSLMAALTAPFAPSHAASTKTTSKTTSIKSEPLTPPSAPAAPAPAARNLGAGFPSFLLPNDVLCFDELDYNAFSKTGQFHTRGSTESCTQMTQLTRVVVLQQTGRKSKVRIVSGPLEAHVGWSNGQLPFPGPK
jgi:hypothetical protein